MNIEKMLAIGVAGVNGLLGVALVMVILSGKFSLVDPSVAIAFNTNLQLTLMIVTVLKLGADSIILSQCLKYGTGYNYIYHYKKIYPIVIAAFFGIFYFKGIEFGVLLVLSAMLDVFSILKTAELNAKQRSIIASFSGLFYIPIACSIIFIEGNNGKIIPYAILAGSAARFFYVFFIDKLILRKINLVKLIAVPSISLMIFQQAFNFLIFRSDQMVIGILYERQLVSDFIGGGLLWSKAVEFYTAATLIAAAVIFPTLITGSSINFKRLSVIFKSSKIYILLLFLLLITVFFSMTIFLKKNNFDERSIPFFLQAILVVPANFLTYVLFKKNKILIAIKAAFLAIILSFLFLFFVLYLNFEMWILFVGFFQLIFYIFIIIFIDGLGDKSTRNISFNWLR